MNTPIRPSLHARTRRRVMTALAVVALACGVGLPAASASAATTRTPTIRHVSTGSPMADTVRTAAPFATAARLDELGGLVSQRLALAEPVAQAKWVSGKPISDPAREQVVVDEAVALATQQGVDTALVTRVIRAQISASKVVQRGLFTTWTHRPETAPTQAPDLTTIRPQLDRIDTDLVAAIGRVQDVAQDPRCGHLVDAARKDLSVGGDALLRKGVRAAWSGFCAP